MAKEQRSDLIFRLETGISSFASGFPISNRETKFAARNEKHFLSVGNTDAQVRAK
jgi:hypothetical protein